MALRLLTSALVRPELRETEAIAIVEYHLKRNRTALKSHTNSWHRRHKKVKYKVLL
jgi:hypothetical protein